MSAACADLKFASAAACAICALNAGSSSSTPAAPPAAPAAKASAPLAWLLIAPVLAAPTRPHKAPIAKSFQTEGCPAAGGGPAGVLGPSGATPDVFAPVAGI